MGSASLAAARPAARPPARPPGPWRQYPSSPEGWGVKIDLQGKNKSIVLSMIANKFTEVPHTIGCKIPQGIVC